MNAITFYLLQVILCSGILYGYYLLLLQNKRFHQYNRFYLLLSVLLSLIVPLLEFKIDTGSAVDPDYILLQNILIKSYQPAEGISHKIGNWLLQNLSAIVYSIVALMLFIKLTNSVRQLLQMKKQYRNEQLQNITIFYTNEPGTPFSFFRWLFWNNAIKIHSHKGQQIFMHEFFHIKQKHSWDKIILEIVSIVFWINPFFYLIKKELTTIHEFLADRYATRGTDKLDYAEMLVLQALSQKNQLVHPFFNNQIKRRIAMITNAHKTSYYYLRRLLVLPMLLTLIAFFAINCTNNADNKPVAEDTSPVPEKTTATNTSPDSITPPAIPAAPENVEEPAKVPLPPPPKVDVIKFTPPKIVKDKKEEVKFTPPKIIKDEKNDADNEDKSIDKVFEKVEVDAQFPGGDQAWRKYLQHAARGQVASDNGAPPGKYKVVVQFIVKEDGKISNVEALTNFGHGMEAEAVRVLKAGPDWVPAVQNSKIVTAFRSQPITFVVSDE